MFKIGEFSRLAGVSAKSLRHYDEVGLFRPVWVDPTNGYRFYSPAQLPELYRVLSLKELGISLADIADLVGGGVDLDDVLRRRRAALEGERVELERRLAAVDIRVDIDGSSEHPDVVLRHLEAELVAGLRLWLEPDESLEAVFGELETYVRDAGARAVRPPATLVYEEREHGARDVEAVVPLEHPVASTERISCRRLSGGRAAALIRRGGYEGLPAARSSLEAWMSAARLEPSGPLRIVYLQFGADASLRVPPLFLAEEASDFVTELQQRIDA